MLFALIRKLVFRAIILCAKLLYRKQIFFYTFLRKTSSFFSCWCMLTWEMSFCSAISLILLRLDFSWGLPQTKTNLSQLSSSVPWNTNKKLFIQGSLFEVTQLPTFTLKVWETTQVPLSLKVTILIFLVAIKVINVFSWTESNF